MIIETTLQPRGYQVDAVEEFLRRVGEGDNRQLLASATGSGKTEMSLLASQWMHERGIIKPGEYALMVADRITLAQQAALRAGKSGFTVSLLQADKSFRTPNSHMVIATVQTLKSRHGNKLPRGVGALIFDEAHVVHRYHVRLAEGFDKLPLLGLSATPERDGLAALYDGIIHTRSIRELIADGYLVPAVYYVPPQPDLSGVGMTGAGFNRDYNQQALAERMRNKQLVGDIVTHWERHGDNRQTVCFCVDIAHAEAVALDFRNAGIPAKCLHAYTDAREGDGATERHLEAFRRRELRVLTSVVKLAVGFDDPGVGCVILARPTKRVGSYVQMGGRGLRIDPANGKKDCIVLDHAGCVLAHGRLEDYEPPLLDMSGLEHKRALKKKRGTDPIPCPECHFLMDRTVIECPACGHVRIRRSAVADSDERLVAMNGQRVATAQLGVAEMQQLYAEIAGYWELRGKDWGKARGIAYAHIAENHNFKVPWSWRDLEAQPPSPATTRAITRSLMAYRRRMAR